MPTDRQIHKENVVHTHNRILCNLKKEGTLLTCCNMDELWGRYAKWNGPLIKGQIPYDSTHMKYQR